MKKHVTHPRSSRIALLIFAASPIGALAQSPDPANAVEAIEAGRQVRLDVAQMGLIEGRFLGADRTTLTLDRDGAPAQLQLGDIERVWERGRSTGRGAWIGAAVGVVAGVIVGVQLRGICKDDGIRTCTAGELAAVTGLVFGAGGAVVGAGIGFVIPTWRLRFP
jgi:hypothetical protein